MAVSCMSCAPFHVLGCQLLLYAGVSAEVSARSILDSQPWFTKNLDFAARLIWGFDAISRRQVCESIDAVWLVCRGLDAGYLRIRKAQPLVHILICRFLCVGFHLRLPARRMAVWPCRSSMVRRGGPPLVGCAMRKCRLRQVDSSSELIVPRRSSLSSRMQLGDGIPGNSHVTLSGNAFASCSGLLNNEFRLQTARS
jgi:hypothetical protein